MPKKSGLLLALGAVYIIWGTTYFAIQIGLESLPPFLLAAIRFSLAGLLLLAVARATRWERTEAGDWWQATLLGLTLVTGSAGASAWSMKTVESGSATLVASLTPCWIVLIDSLRSMRGPGTRALVAVVCGLLGALVLFAAGSERIDLSGGLGLVFAGWAWAFGTIWGRRRSRIPTLQSTAMFMTIGGASLFPVAMLQGELAALPTAELTMRSALALAYLTVFGSIVVLCAYSWLLGRTSASVAASHAYVNPVVALMIGAVWAGERLTPAVLISALLSLAAVVLLMFPKRKGVPILISLRKSVAPTAGSLVPHPVAPVESLDQKFVVLFGEIGVLRERIGPLPSGLRREYEELLKGLSRSATKLRGRLTARTDVGQPATARQREELERLCEHLERIRGLFVRRLSDPEGEQRRLLDVENKV